MSVTADPKTISSSDLWLRAIATAQGSERWAKFCELVPNAKTATDREGLLNIMNQVHNDAATLGDSKIERVRNLGAKVAQVVTAIKDVGAAVTALNPYASLAWSGVQFLLGAALANHEAKQLCKDTLPRLVCLISRYQTFEEVYKIDSAAADKSMGQLEDQIVEFYALLLQCLMVTVLYTNSKWKKVVMAVRGVANNALQAMLNDLRQTESEIDRLRAIVDREMASSSFQDIFDELSDLQKSLRSLELDMGKVSQALDTITIFVEERKRQDILDWISKYEYMNSHENQSTST